MKALLLIVQLTLAFQLFGQQVAKSNTTLKASDTKPSVSIQTTDLSLSDYLFQNDLTLQDIQAILIIEQNGQLILSNGDMIGINQNTSHRIVVFYPSSQFDTNLLQVKIDNSFPINLNDNKNIEINGIKNLEIILSNSSIEINL